MTGSARRGGGRTRRDGPRAIGRIGPVALCALLLPGMVSRDGAAQRGSAVAADAAAPPARGPASVHAPGPERGDGIAAGAIAGRVVLERRVPRRVTSRYAGGAPVVRTVEPVPAVVLVHGAIGAAEPPAAPPRIAQQDTTFRPPVLIVPVGGTVEFPNEDPFFHNVFSFSRAKRFDLGRYPEGESKSVVFDEPGVVEVYCEVHKWMRAAVVVVENPFHATVAEDGRFRIDGVPAGRHRLTVWEFDHGQATVEVEVPSDGVARVEVTL